MIGWLDVPRDWLDSVWEIARFGTRVMGLVLSGRVFRFFGEGLRQAGILIFGSAVIIWAVRLHPRPPMRAAGRLLQSLDRRSLPWPVSSRPTATCARAVPYAFGYILSPRSDRDRRRAGAMRISDEIDALEVMGIQPMTFLAATRLLGAGSRFPSSTWSGSPSPISPATSPWSNRSRRLLRRLRTDLLDVPEARPICFSLIKGMVMATAIVLVGCYYGYTASGGPVGVGTATAQSMVVNIILVPHHRHARHRRLLGSNQERRSGA